MTQTESTLKNDEFEFQLVDNVECKIHHCHIIVSNFASLPFESLEFDDSQGITYLRVALLNADDDITAELFLDFHSDFLALLDFAASNGLTKPAN